jgi:SAM-dependent methyltransferase
MNLRSAIRNGPRMLRRTPKIVRNALRDLRYGAPLGGTIKTRHAHLGAHDIGNADYDDLALLFADAGVSAEDVLVDVGCGKGRALNWFLARYPDNTIYGIELDEEICARTARRLRRFANVKVVCGDATKLLPEEGTVFYLFNPFGEPVMRAFAAALGDLPARADGRQRRVVYYNTKHLAPFEEDARFAVRPLERPTSFAAALIEVR